MIKLGLYFELGIRDFIVQNFRPISGICWIPELNIVTAVKEYRYHLQFIYRRYLWI
jgi:hypothetical protein